MRPPIAIAIIILLLASLACSAVTVEVNVETSCVLVEGFDPAPNNVHEVFLGEELYATLEYTNGTFTIYDSEHTAVDTKSVSPDEYIEGTLSAEYESSETTKEVAFAVCGGTLYIRETERGRNTLDA